MKISTLAIAATAFWAVGNGAIAQNVGIGTATPAAKLHVFENTPGALGPVLRIENSGGSFGAASAIDMPTYAPGAFDVSSRIMTIDDGIFGNHITFWNKVPGVMNNPLAERMRLSNTGNLGIGTTAPTARLHINGAYANTFTALAAGAAPAIADNVSHVRLTDDGAAAANAITGPAAPVDGQVITIVNNDAQAATFAGATIAASTGAASFVYANGAWRVYGNSASASGWGLTGNSGTVAGTNYIGTNDNNALDIRTNGQVRAQFTTTGAILMQNPAVNGNTIIGNTASATTSPTGTNNTMIGRLAGNALTAGQSNTAVGAACLQNNTIGNNNTAMGNNALRSNTTGGENVGLGSFSLFSNTTGLYNTAINFGLGANTTGSGNNAIGGFALNANTTGSDNNALGYSAGDLNTIGTRNTFVGHVADAGANNLTNATAIGAYSRVDADNSVVLGSVNGINSATATANVGIGLNAPTARLHINGAYANTHSTVAAAAAPAIATNISHLRLTATAGVQANILAAPAGPVEGQVLSIVNEDDNNAYFSNEVILANGGVNTYLYAGGVWRLQSSSWRGGDLLYPHGTQNMTPLYRNGTMGAYVVPAGKVLYITEHATPGAQLVVNGIWVANGTFGFGADFVVRRLQEQPILVGAGGNVVINGGSPHSHWTGYLVDENTAFTPVVVTLAAPYVVPAGRTLVITNIATHAAFHLLFNGAGNQLLQAQIASGGTQNHLNAPIIIPGGAGAQSVIQSSGANNTTIMGYLR